MYQLIISHNIRDVYPNTEIALRIFLTTPIANCSAERSFSALKRIKNYLGTSVSQDPLNFW